MKLILVAGGSGGHIYPCLEMAKFFIAKNHQVLMCGNKNSMEEKIYRENNLNFEGIDISKNKLNTYLVNRKKIKKIYEDYKPDAILLFGNYISVSFAIVAIGSKIPIYLHEQNVIYGNANLLLGIFAKKIYLSLPIKNDIYKKKSLLTGNPKGEYLAREHKFKRNKNVVIAMGSLGSSSINKVIKELINIVDKNIDFHIVVGKKYYTDFIKGIKIINNIHLYPYIENLSKYIKSCDVFVSRAGATTISEILINSVASILIPSPYVKKNHQYLNAKYLYDNDACILINESELNANNLNDSINGLINNYNQRLALKVNARKLAISNSKNNIYKDMIKDYEG